MAWRCGHSLRAYVVLAANEVSEVGGAMMMTGVATSKVSRAMTDGGGYSPHMWHGRCARLGCYTARLQRWLARGNGNGVAAHHSPLPCHIRGMGAPRGHQPTCFLVGVLLG